LNGCLEQRFCWLALQCITDQKNLFCLKD
jgi:hypothetical protein